AVRHSRSLLPRSSPAWPAKRSPRKSASPRPSDWIMVPMAPSMMTMRSASKSRSPSVAARSAMAAVLRGGAWTDAQRVTHGTRQLGVGAGIEMELPHAESVQAPALLHGHRRAEHGGYRRARLRAGEQGGHPVRNRRAAGLREALHPSEIGHRQ